MVKITNIGCKRGLFIVSGISIVLAAASLVLVDPVLKARPSFYNFVEAFLREGPTDYVVNAPWGYTLPSGYVGMIAGLTSLFHREEFLAGGNNLWAVFVAQAILYVSAVIGSYITLIRARTAEWVALLGAAGVALHPYLLLNIKRFADNIATIPLVVAVVYSIVDGTARGENRSWKWWIGVGILYGITLSVRPSLVLFVGVGLLYIVYPSIKQCIQNVTLNSILASIRPILTVIGMSVLILLSTSFLAKGTLELAPKKLAYNLFIGANPYTLESLVKNRSAEPIRGKVINLNSKVGKISSKVKRFKNARKKMLKIGYNYMRKNPAKYAGLGVVKVANLLLPDYRAAERRSGWSKLAVYLIQTILFLPISLWICIKVLAYSFNENIGEIPVGLLFLGYILPVFFTQSDPRIRYPLDVLFLISSLIISYRLYFEYKRKK